MKQMSMAETHAHSREGQLDELLVRASSTRSLVIRVIFTWKYVGR